MDASIDLPAVLEAHLLWSAGHPGGRRADLRGADLTEANLAGVNLYWVNLYWVNLTGADLTCANLGWATLTGANLAGARLRGTDLHWADLDRANLYWADLRDANLRGTVVDRLLDDDGRGYQVIARSDFLSDEPVYQAGCRTLILAGARKHWTNPGHEYPDCARRILAAIEAHAAKETP